MTKDRKQPWIEVGYDLFSKHGPSALKVEVIAKRVNKSKSSFYHHFADLEVFINLLLRYHIAKSDEIAVKAKECQVMVPDFLDLLLDIKEDLLFNRQLRINRGLVGYQECFEKANKPVEKAFLKIWSKPLGLEKNESLAQVVLNLAVENFYLRITDESLTREWLLAYWSEIKLMIKGLKQS